jgi:hypothetical protein
VEGGGWRMVSHAGASVSCSGAGQRGQGSGTANTRGRRGRRRMRLLIITRTMIINGTTVRRRRNGSSCPSLPGVLLSPPDCCAVVDPARCSWLQQISSARAPSRSGPSAPLTTPNLFLSIYPPSFSCLSASLLSLLSLLISPIISRHRHL